MIGEEGNQDGRKWTYSILIPALNERANIGDLLDDILTQEEVPGFVLEKTLVISDCSTDDTNQIVERYAAREGSTVELLVNPERLGKPDTLNRGIAAADSDYLVLFDADVRLNGPLTLRTLLEDPGENVGLICGNPVPAARGDSLAALVSRCGDIMRNTIMIRIRGGSNIYSAHGRIMALSRRLYTHLEVPEMDGGNRVIATDQYIYLSCIKQGLRYEYRGEAEVFFILPLSFRDYFKQSVRFMFTAGNTKAYFDDRRLDSEYDIPLSLKLVAFIDLCRREPIGAIAWTANRLAGRVIYFYKKFIRRKGMPAAWDVSGSTKGKIGAP